MAAGKLLLLPNLLDESLMPEASIPPSVGAAVKTIQGLIAESEKSARRYLRKFLSHEEMAKMPISLLNEHTSLKEIEALSFPLQNGQTWGLISDAGLACIADPGAPLVALCLEKKIGVETFAGPSSILMALQLSGFSGQKFSFHGYLPREIPDLEKKILELEKTSGGATQIWIEAPYRSAKMLDALKKILRPETRVCVAVNLTLPTQRVASHKISSWKTLPFPLEKEPAVFLLSTV